jgi:hypothetical protein
VAGNRAANSTWRWADGEVIAADDRFWAKGQPAQDKGHFKCGKSGIRFGGAAAAMTTIKSLPMPVHGTGSPVRVVHAAYNLPRKQVPMRSISKAVALGEHAHCVQFPQFAPLRGGWDPGHVARSNDGKQTQKLNSKLKASPFQLPFF